MASPLRLSMRLSTAVAFLLVASSLAPAFAARVLQDTSTTPAPVQTQPASLVFGTVTGPRFPWASVFGSPNTAPCSGSECVSCPEDTGYAFTLTNNGKICTKTYPVAQASGQLPGPDGSFTGPSKTDSFGLGRDFYERVNGDILETCFSSTKQILDQNLYGKLNPSMYLVTETQQFVDSLPAIQSWFDMHFKDKKPTVQIFDVGFDTTQTPNAPSTSTYIGVSFVVRAETDVQVVTFSTYWINPVTVTQDTYDKWTLYSVRNVKVANKA
ncbi:hypothetical protein KFL_003310020 [Klebsormidium nitens]|uniref:Uncharacterized protein n=1 Tax=Klebsormidium nitens TaxID=105231 RepID=A0A1Y1I824_KLENI|nr:hypothetical protein KFL_003310020 [Klebsormidium nitens]|eukprot:GAQ87090.1 hypothetical protein KFL_003310020 [Klebsormidium nitens]